MQSLPSATQRPPKQQPLLQVLPAQQLSPGPPHLAHKPSMVLEVAEQMAPATQRSAPPVAEQQASPSPPQVEQVPDRQSRPVAHEGVVVPQQGWLGPPQPEQRPATQEPPEAPPAPESALVQAAFSARQRPSKQQPLPSQMLPGQQAVPVLPQVVHSEVDELPLQTSPLAEQT
jgi:hypothetical protein